jgi:hypothetical protein
MAFWDDAIRNVQNFFSGGNSQKKKKDDEQRQIQRVVSSPAPNRAPGITGNQPQNPLQVKQPTDLFGTLNNTGQNALLKQPAAPKPVKPVPVKKTVTQQLDELTDQNMGKAKKQVEQGQNWFDRGVSTINGTNDKIARQNARNQAVGQFQEKNGYNKDPEVMKYIGNTRDLGQKTSKQISDWGKNLDTTQKVTDKVAQGIQYVPVAGSVFNLGLAANQKLADSRGTDIVGNSKDTARGLRNKVDFGMTNEEYDKLDDKTKGKLETIRNIGLALTPLDFTGVGGIAKSEGVAVAKKAALNVVKREAIDEATKQGLKTALKSTVKTALPTAAVGTGISAAAQGYLTGEVDPLEAFKGGLMTAGTGMLIPNGNKVNVPTSKNIEINAPTTYNKRVPVTVKNTERPLINEMTTDPGLVPQPTRTPVPIREIGGDTPGVNQVQVPTAADRFASQPAARPDSTVEGMLPGKVEDTTLYSKAEVDTERAALDDALANGEINKTAHKAANAQLDSLPLSDAPTNKVQIPVKQVRDIPVDEISSMPHPVEKAAVEVPTKAATNSNEVVQTVNPATGEKTFYRIPSDQRDAIVNGIDNARDGSAIAGKNVGGVVTHVTARTPEDMAARGFTDGGVYGDTPQVQTNKPILPDDVQAVLDNPKQFNKRQVASARNQRKLANQMAKTKEQTAEAIGRIDAVSPDAQTAQGFVPTGEFGKSVNGGAYQKVNRASEMQAAVQETANLAPGDVIRTARETAAQNGGGFNRRDIRNIAALFETKRLERGTPEWNEARQILKEDGTNWGQAGALRNYTMRRTASADELISRFESKIYRLADDPSKIDGKLFDQVDAAESNYVDTRDAAMQAYNRFTESPTQANAKAYHTAQDAADKADKVSKQTQFTVAQQALKGNKDVQQARELEKMAQQADMYQMDAVDSSMLSGTGTFVRNLTNASVGNLEEGLMGRVSSRIASKLTGQNVGGGGMFGGMKKGAINVVDASKARAEAAGKNPLEHLKNWATTGNQLGDAVIDGQVSRNVGDHYRQMLKDQGYKGAELKNRASVMARQDPDNITETYQGAARTAAGLGSGITRNNKVETLVKNIISDTISGGKPNQATENIAKLVTRMTLGFPTAIGRSVAEGAKRFTLGAPTFIKAMRTEDPQARAILIKEGIKQAGSGGLVIPSLFYGLGASGSITGAYPDDQAERDRWEREGITENSIKIGDDYYQLPAYLGSWAIPALFYAGLGRNNGDFGAAATDMKSVIPSMLPTDSISNLTDVINGRTDLGKWAAQTGAGMVRAATPGGALLNEIGKMIDPTQNDTNSGSVWENLVSKVINGIPGANLGLDAKTDSEGNPLANPDPLALGLGAASTEQQAGIQRSQEIDTQTNTVLGDMASYGAFDDPNLKSVITDSKTKKIYSDILAGKQVNPEDLKKVQEAMVKGVSEKGTDTAYLEREQYDTNLAALRVKRELMAADPTQKPSDLKAMDTAIKRGEVYRDNQIPYDLIDGYQNTSLTEWRAMGNPESDDYDPDRYNQLWAIDKLMTENGVSYAKGKLEKQKFSAKGAGSGKGGGSGSKMSTDFGTLKDGIGAPSVQQYQSIDQQSGSVPVIQVQRPNIVHKIGFSG